MSCSSAVNSFSLPLAAIINIGIAQDRLSAAPCPCDIYAAGGTPCVAAHSMVRALYSSYNGPLYQVKRTSDKQTRDIGVLTAGGYADAAAQDSFLGGKAGTISIIYDQSSKGNHLKVAPAGGWLSNGGAESNASDTSIKMNGHKVYGLYTKRGMGYRNNQTSSMPTGNKPEGMYMVASGKHVNDSCCYDYGNAETNMKDNGTGTMETINLSKECWFTPCTGSGPWVFADLENGLFAGGSSGHNTKNTSVPYDYVTAMVKGNATTYTIRAGNAQSGTLKTMTDSNSARPAPDKLEGAIILGVGGDNSWAGVGTFFEGAITTGRPLDTTEDAVQKNIVAAGYGVAASPVSTRFNPNEAVPESGFNINYNPSNGNTVIGLDFSQPASRGELKVCLFDLTGRLAATLFKGRAACRHLMLPLNSKETRSGAYFVKVWLNGKTVLTKTITPW